MILLDVRLRCSAVHQIKTEDVHEETTRPLRVIRAICINCAHVEQNGSIKGARRTNKSTEIVHTDHSFLFVVKVVLNYAGSF